ncbi:PaaI family thioesterase [Maribacter sp. 2307ULW6-5]|uniref:PaaI family thioesterase n=1 Tax=Maribacter sp. 2307ULW6-5 TaxID=3386275 RepID=UPI0039BD1DBA
MTEHKDRILKVCNDASENTLMQTLDIVYTDVGEDFLVARMPVGPKVYQPDGILHGGATVALAESVGSMACYIFLDAEHFFVRGIEISANHLKGAKEGFVYARATFVHKGRTTQLWDIKVTDEAQNLISVVRLSTISLPKK